jgi:hypothetical protein
VWQLSELKAQAIAAIEGRPSARDPSLPNSELQRLLAEALGAEGIVEWLDVVRTLPPAYEHTQLETARRVLSPAHLAAWLGGMFVPPMALGLSRYPLPPATGIPWLCHIASSLVIKQAGPLEHLGYTVTVRRPLRGVPGVLLGIGDHEVTLSREDARMLTNKIVEVINRPKPGCTDAFAHWEGHCGCT